MAKNDIGTGLSNLTSTQISANMGALASFSMQNLFGSHQVMRLPRKLAAEVRAAVARRRVYIAGDSLSTGRSAGTGTGNWIGARPKAPVAFACQELNARGVPARCDAFFGVAGRGSTPADYALYNPNVSFGANWTRAAMNAPGSSTFESASPNTDAMVFTPERAADRFDIWYLANAGYGTFTVTDASGTLATVNSVGSGQFVKVTVTRAVASIAPISIQRNGTGGIIRISGIDPWNSTLPELCFLNAAASGSSTLDWIDATAPISNLNALGTIAPDYMLCELGVNDKNLGYAVSDMQTRLGTIIQKQIDTVGAHSAALMLSNPGKNGTTYNLTDDWRAAIIGVAAQKSAPLIDHYSRFITWEEDPSLYAAGSDTIHQTATALAMKGRLIASLFLS